MPQMAELYLRHNYAKQHRLAEDKRQLEERTEQLLCEKERLLYDVQRRGHPLDDEDDRSAIRRGLQAGLSRPYHPADDTDPSEPGGPAPSGSPPPSLPPGAPPSTAGDSTAATWEDANWLTEEGLVLARSSQGLAGFEGVYASGAGFGANLQKGAKRLRQDGFSSAGEAALERARWTKSLMEGKGQASSSAAEASSREEQLAAEALLAEMVLEQGVAQHQQSFSPVHPHTPREHKDPISHGLRPTYARASRLVPQITTETIVPLQQVVADGPSQEAPIEISGVAPPSALQQKFAALVMCNFTPMPPSVLPKSQWVSYQHLFRLFEPHVPTMDVWMMGPGNLKQMIIKWFECHPAFAGLEASAWCKRFTNKDPQDAARGGYIFQLSFQYTPNGAPVPRGRASLLHLPVALNGPSSFPQPQYM